MRAYRSWVLHPSIDTCKSARRKTYLIPIRISDHERTTRQGLRSSYRRRRAPRARQETPHAKHNRGTAADPGGSLVWDRDPVDWKKSSSESDTDEIVWWNENRSAAHFKKVVELNFLGGIKYEYDFYKNAQIKYVYPYSNFDFDENKFEYFIEKPNTDRYEITENGKVQFADRFIVSNISKIEFEKFLRNENQ